MVLKDFCLSLEIPYLDKFRQAWWNVKIVLWSFQHWYFLVLFFFFALDDSSRKTMLYWCFRSCICSIFKRQIKSWVNKWDKIDFQKSLFTNNKRVNLTDQELMNNLSHSPTIFWISSLTFENLFLTIETVMTFLVVPQAAPKAFFEGTKTYGTF